MDKGLWVAIIGSTGVVLASLFSRPHKLKNERDSIRNDIEIYNMLPKGSSARKELLDRIDENVIDFLVENRKIRRDLRGGIKSLVIVFLLAGIISFMIYAAWIVPEKTKFPATDYVMLIFVLVVISLFLIFYLIRASLELQKKLRDPSGRASDGSDYLGE